MQAFEVGQDFEFAPHVERGERLVHQQQAGRGKQRARNRRALALAAGQRGGTGIEQAFDAEQFGYRQQIEAALGGLEALASELEIGAHGQVREQARFLEHVADAPFVGRHEHLARIVLPHLVAQRDAGAGHALQARQHAQQRGLAGARVPEQRRHAAPGQGQVDIEIERAAVDPACERDGRHRCVPRIDCGYSVYKVSSTTKLNTSMPPASQWACAYSIAST